MQIFEIPISQIRPYAHNPRKNNDAAADAVAESIRQFGFRQPLVVDREHVIVCGHTRYKAAQKLGLNFVPCVLADDLTEEQINAYRLADNKTGEIAQWGFQAGDERAERHFRHQHGQVRFRSACGRSK